MKREYLLLTMLPLIAYANTGYYAEEQEGYELEEADEYVGDQSGYIADSYRAPAQNANAPQQQNMHPDQFQLYTHDKGFFIGAEFLYWTVKEGSSLEYGFAKNFPVFLVAPTDGAVGGLNGRAKQAEFDGAPGFRVNAGYQIGHDNWEILAVYTWFHTQGKNHVNKPPGTATEDLGEANSVVSSVYPGLFEDPNAKIKSRIRITENVLDLKVEKYTAPSRFLVLGLNAGYEGAWINQHWRLRNVSVPPTLQHSTTKQNWSFSGAGPLIGVDADWYLTKRFTLYFDAMGGLLYGYHKFHITTDASSGDINDDFQDARSKGHRFVPHTKLEIGLDWDCRFWHYGSFNIYAGYEINTWFNLQEAYHYNHNGSNTVGADVAYSVERNVVNTHGLTLGVEFHF